ncbi:hypothetical protein [Pseudactinotalea sp. Z1748]|uniref:hypothetical protein n=1 Tax=Pseudactinotalea sp. Z1748 TaxID=3413027 RepID=UPI003C7E2F0A
MASVAEKVQEFNGTPGKPQEPSEAERTADLADEWVDAIERVPAQPKATIKAWMDARNGQQVRTYQFTHDVDTNTASSPWSPGARIVRATKASLVQMDRGEGRNRPPATTQGAG